MSTRNPSGGGHAASGYAPAAYTAGDKSRVPSSSIHPESRVANNTPDALHHQKLRSSPPIEEVSPRFGSSNVPRGSLTRSKERRAPPPPLQKWGAKEKDTGFYGTTGLGWTLVTMLAVLCAVRIFGLPHWYGNGGGGKAWSSGSSAVQVLLPPDLDSEVLPLPLPSGADASADTGHISHSTLNAGCTDPKGLTSAERITAAVEYEHQSRKDRPACRAVLQKRYIFAISNGHTGTLTFATKGNYCGGLCRQPASVAMEFEQGKKHGLVGRSHQKDYAPYHNMRQWYHAAAATSDAALRAAETKLVQELYLPSWETSLNSTGTDERGGASALGVFGHDVLLYYRGILNTIDLDKMLFIRIRRSRCEVAESWHKNFGSAKFCKGWYLYCPFEAETAVVLKVTAEQWNALSPHGRALWYVDEVEARWHNMVLEYPRLETLETPVWSKYAEGSFAAAESDIAAGFGLQGLSKPESPTHLHVKHVDETADDFRAFCKKEDDAYRKVMQYTQAQRQMLVKIAGV